MSQEACSGFIVDKRKLYVDLLEGDAIIQLLVDLISVPDRKFNFFIKDLAQPFVDRSNG